MTSAAGGAEPVSGRPVGLISISFVTPLPKGPRKADRAISSADPALPIPRRQDAKINQQGEKYELPSYFIIMF